MSIDPLAAGLADLASFIDAELASLAADAQALRDVLTVGAVVDAKVLAPNGLTDLLEIAGNRVAASLPPNVHPGDTIRVTVTGFDGDRILVQIVNGESAQPGAPPASPLAPPPGAFVAASIVPAAPLPTGPLPAATPPAATPSAATGAVADGAPPATSMPNTSLNALPAAAAEDAARRLAQTPRAIVTIAAPPPGAAQNPATVAPPRSGSPAAYAATQRAEPGPSPGSAGAAPRPSAETAPTSIEARLAAAAASAARAAGTSAGASSRPAAAGAPAAAVPLPAAPPPVRGFVPPLQIVPKGSAEAAPPAPPVAAANAVPAPSGLSAYAEPVALLRALRLPVTPATVASATTALAHPERVAAALRTLEGALPRGSGDANVATLRALLPFVGRIDPKSPALAAQIAAFVDHVVDGAEPKLATLLAATAVAAAAEDAAPAGGGPASAAANAAPPVAGALPGAAPSGTHPAGVIAAAVATERSAALGADLKQTIMAVAADVATPASLAPALAGALSALTAVQAQAATLLAAQPDGLAFTIPLLTPNGTHNAQIRVARDGPQGRGAVADASNFRIAFVLDTAHFGTVALDLVTVGREVTVEVRAENGGAVRAFRDGLNRLTDRLTSLRYTVASAEAKIGTTTTVGVAAAPTSAVDPDAVVDRNA